MRGWAPRLVTKAPVALSYFTNDTFGVIIPTHQFPEGLKEDIMNYFKERNEDE